MKTAWKIDYHPENTHIMTYDLTTDLNEKDALTCLHTEER